MSLSLSILYTTSKQSNKIMYSIDITSFALNAGSANRLRLPLCTYHLSVICLF